MHSGVTVDPSSNFLSRQRERNDYNPRPRGIRRQSDSVTCQAVSKSTKVGSGFNDGEKVGKKAFSKTNSHPYSCTHQQKQTAFKE